MAIYLTLVLIVLTHIAFSGSRVVVSLMALESGATQMQVGILMALYAVCPMLFAIAIGRLADRVGARPPMLLGTVGVGIALVLPALWPSMTTLYLSSLLLGTSFHFFFVTVTGIAGGLFARMLLISASGWRGRLGDFRRDHPYRFAAACGLFLAILGWATGGLTYSSGYEETRNLLSRNEEMPWHFGPAKFVATVVSYLSGLPGGIFAPSLARKTAHAITH